MDGTVWSLKWQLKTKLGFWRRRELAVGNIV